MSDFAALAEQYRGNLMDDVIPFWERNSIDRDYGGYFNCLDRQGKVFDTDKFMWLQAREVWTFSMLYSRLEQRQEWIDIARHGAEFILKHGMNEVGDWYFSLNRQGQPLMQPYSIFTDCFAAMGLSQYAAVTGDEQAKQLAIRTFGRILKRKDNPRGPYNKAYPGTRPMKTFAIPMILANLLLELEWLLDPQEFRTRLDECIAEIMGTFVDKEQGIIYENVAPDGSHPDTFEGRCLLPGHGIEGMWFLMDVGRKLGDTVLIEKCTDVALNIIDYGWDPEYGGIVYYRDALGKPPLQYEWDQKLWWVHVESLVAFAYGYLLTGRQECWEWYERVHDYTWSHFPDPEYGEWFAYLNRRGEVYTDCKGGKWKCCFHVPRALLRCYRIFSELAEKDTEII